jgi:predicted nucleotidyltransferase
MIDTEHEEYSAPSDNGGHVVTPDGQIEVPAEILAEICSRYRVSELSIFGSASSGRMRPDSDVDLLVVFESGARIGLVAFARLRNELAEAFGRAVDLVPKEGLKSAIKAEVLTQARTLYAA